MTRQKRQLMIMLLVLIIAVAALVFVWRLPAEEEDIQEQRYQITALEEDQISRFSFANESGMCNFTRQDGTWISEEDRSLEIDGDAVARLIGKIASLSSSDCIEQVEDSAQYGLDEPAATILISDGTTGCTLLVGDYNELTETYYLCLESDKGTVYTADPYTVSDFIDKSMEDLVVQQEETETAAE
ncbi:MAG: DUF4340 domain-containing protein [Lachnospiraceae bacterium]|nr:DUF4340 domain-containing protein [Lachnospiraceae bacterium]MDE6918284.1 DUF4340 domain-containing protein [Lachnospiraceae bacterium]